MTSGQAQEFVWLNGATGEILSPDAMEARIAARRGQLMGRTASTVVFRPDDGTGVEETFTRTAGDVIFI